LSTTNKNILSVANKNQFFDEVVAESEIIRVGWGYSDQRRLFGSVAIWIKFTYLIFLKHFKIFKTKV
jgi:hypothetical protein